MKLSKTFLPTYSQKKFPKKIEKKRAHLYQALEKILESDLCSLELIAPIVQAYDPEFSNAKKRSRHTGFCFGYGETWLNQIGEHYDDPPTFKNWEDLTTINILNPADWNVFPLTNSIIEIQQKQSTFSHHQKIYQSAKIFRNTRLLLNALEQFLNHALHQSTGSEPMSLILSLSAPPELVSLQFFLALWTLKYPRYLSNWHDIRIYIDPNQKIHWFDSNIGWFRSKESNPNLSGFITDLTHIFELLRYSQKYSVLAIYDHTKKLALRANP